MPMTPKIIYGTAWKEEKTAPLVTLALEQGFRAIDTANQRKHYFESAVGEALLKAYKHLAIKREELFLQTKYTYARGQDHRKPYDDKDPYDEQVIKSFHSSLEHLHTDYIDAYLLHGPHQGGNISDVDKIVWTTFESLVNKKQIKHLGVSNISASQLQELIDYAKIKPRFVQNRCFAVNAWDKVVRELCKTHKIHYQGFSLLTANVDALHKIKSMGLEQQYNKTLAQIVFMFAHAVGIIPLVGTHQAKHMQDDLACHNAQLQASDISMIENIYHEPLKPDDN